MSTAERERDVTAPAIPRHHHRLAYAVAAVLIARDVTAPAIPRHHHRLAYAVAAVLMALLVRGLVAEPLTVSSDSMSPTLVRGDHVLVEKVSSRFGGVDRGDLVAFHSPADGELALKRAVGLPGDTVEIRDAELYVNERRVEEPFVDHSRIDGTYFGPVTVPAGGVFVLGDRRAGSVDSRRYGAVPASAVVGRVVFTV
jgi:signal peptidase I